MLFLKTSEECNYQKKKKEKKKKKERGICVIKAQNQANKSAGKTLPKSQTSVPPHFQIYNFTKGFRNPSLSFTLTFLCPS